MLAGGSAYFQILSGFSGGTSASAPLIAALIARINTEIQKETNKPFSIGFINPIIYQALTIKQKSKKRSSSTHNLDITVSYGTVSTPNALTGKPSLMKHLQAMI